MNLFQILDCNTNLGNCCSNRVIAAMIHPINNIINLIQVIVPIILLIMVSVNLTQLVINPDDKKLLKSIKNKFLAAVFVFFVPVIINAFIGMVGESGKSTFNVLNCLKESGNVKISASTKYVDYHHNSKRGKINNDKTDYENGDKKKDNNTTSSGAISKDCVLGDSNVKLVPNDTNGKNAVVKKANGQEVVEYAKSWLNKGLTYKLGTTAELSPGGQCDCSGFVYNVLNHFGILQSGKVKSTVWGSCGVKGTVMYSSYSKLVPGDVVFMDVGNGLGHLELYVGNGETVGCNTGVGVHRGKASSYTSFIHLTAYD